MHLLTLPRPVRFTQRAEVSARDELPVALFQRRTDGGCQRGARRDWQAILPERE